jgi:hypothetical protein
MSDTSLNNYQEALDLIEIFDDKEIKEKTRQIKNTDLQVEATLWSYVNSIFKHVQEDYKFKLYVQDLIKERLMEANLDVLIRLYQVLNNHEERSIAVSLEPFNGGKNTEGSPLLDNIRQVTPSLEENIHNESDTELLKAFNQLNNLLSSISKEEKSSE